MREFAETLEREGKLDESLIVFLADHGSAFRKQFDKRLQDWDEQDIQERFSVFLGVKFPGQKEGKINSRYVQLLDVAPTLLKALGREIPKDMEGRDFRTYEPEGIRVGLAGYLKKNSYNGGRFLYRTIITATGRISSRETSASKALSQTPEPAHRGR